MSLFCEDQVLNISPAYLRPGFAFGGSCLPKDLRVAAAPGPDERRRPAAAGRHAGDQRAGRSATWSTGSSRPAAATVALLGLSFKTDTDDLRESPNVELAERLIGKGFDVRIYDPVVNPARLVGANRRHVESKLPHLGRLLTPRPTRRCAGAEVAVSRPATRPCVAALLAAPPPRI